MASIFQHEAPYLLRYMSLGSEATYEVLDERDGIVTAAVIDAPGLEHGTSVRFTASDAHAIAQRDNAGQQLARTRRFMPKVSMYRGSFRFWHEGRGHQATPRLTHR